MSVKRVGQRTAFVLLPLLMATVEHTPAASQSTTAKPEVTDAFSALKGLSFKRMQELGPKFTPEMRRLRDVFLRNAVDSAPLLVAQLEQLNADESKFVSGPDDIAGGTNYVGSVALSDENPFLKIQIVNILADLYPQLSSEAQAAVLRTLEVSSTPSTHIPHGMAGSIGLAFLTIGAPSLPYLLDMLSNESKFVRCKARDTPYALVPESVRLVASLPKLLCEEASAGRSESLCAWTRWWKDRKGQIPVEKFPTFFEVVYTSEK